MRPRPLSASPTSSSVTAMSDHTGAIICWILALAVPPLWIAVEHARDVIRAARRWEE